MLKELNVRSVKVGTVEVFQGDERELIIISTVRQKLFTHDRREHIGFLSDPKRINVMLTRAKNKVIIIGNPKILERSIYWQYVIDHCKGINSYFE